MPEQSTGAQRCGQFPWLGGCRLPLGHVGEHQVDIKDLPKSEDAQRQQRLLADLAAEGTARCGYHWIVSDWLHGPCDCKYRSPLMPGSSEQTGCAEMRAAYRLLSEETRS